MYDFSSDIKSNSITHGSIPFWSWNDRLEEKELRRQINVMKELGMSGFFMHARGGLETQYLGDEWYDCVRACVDEAKKLGMEAWSYDENGWPSGFAGGILLEDKANHATWLDYKVEDKFPGGEDILGVYTLNNGRLTRVKAPTAAPYHVIYQRWDSSYVDTMDADITRKFIAVTHEEYKKRVGFSESMPGFFTDEPQYYRWATPWSNKMPDEFRKKYGYSVFSALPALFIDFDSAETFRYDYFKLCHELFINNFIKVIYDWCEQNGAQITGHAVEESCLFGQMWCCGGVMPFYEYEHIPGIDYLGRGIAGDLASKQLGSACAQLGKRKAISEMFGCCGWDVTPTELKKIAELQYAGGVNLMCQHLYPYSERGQRKRDYPAHYSEHNPWQSHLGKFNSYFNNLGYTLSLGEEYANTLVIHPIHSAYLNYKRPLDYNSIKELEDNTGKISALLSGNQVAYHWGDENMMARLASVEGDRIRVGKCVYDFVVIPYLYTLDGSTAKLLKEYISNGGRVWIYSDKPTRIDGRIADMSWLNSNITFDTLLKASPVELRMGGEPLPRLRSMVRNTENGRIFFVTNLTDDEYKNVSYKIRGCAGIYALDMGTLEKKRVRYSVSGGDLTATLDFTGAQSYVLIEGIEPAETEIPAEKTAIKLNKPFKFKTLPENMLNLDLVRVSFDGESYSELRPLVRVKDELLSSRYKGMLWLKFGFTADALPSRLSVAVEPLKYDSFKVNGEDIALTDKWWFDRSFLTADISGAVRLGENEITMSLDYFQRDYVYYVLYGGVSESLRNCLNFDTEIEDIYLFGGFEVKTDGSRFTDGERRSVLYDGDFSLTAQKPETDPRDFVKRGYPFYGGAVELETVYDYKAGMGTMLKLGGRFAVADIAVNGYAAGDMLFTDTLDLADYLREGENTIAIKLCNSNRNLMGPHHRRDPESYGVGPGTFSYEREWHDGKCGGYVDRYAFVRFGIDY